MKILHIIAGDLSEGASRGAYWLHQGLLDAGVESCLLVDKSKLIPDSSVQAVAGTKFSKLKRLIRNTVDNYPAMLYRQRKKVVFSSSIVGYDITRHPLYQWADIIHFHWINGGFIKIEDVCKIKKPIVWTMRDMWPFTGGCHYSMGCENYTKDCGNCPLLGSSHQHDLSHWVVKRKKQSYPQNMTLVGISPWLSEKAKESSVFSSFTVRTIFNNINCQDFVPVDKRVAREILGIHTNKKIVLTGAMDSKDYYKGFGNYLEAIRKLDKERVFLLFFGRLHDSEVNHLGFEWKNLGLLSNDILLKLAYSAADVLVAPSLMEAFGKTIAESMACETPVVCFDATGPKDIVDHKINGYKARLADSGDLCLGIEWVIGHPHYKDLCIQARQKALSTFDSSVIARQYVELYQSVLDNIMPIDCKLVYKKNHI